MRDKSRSRLLSIAISLWGILLVCTYLVTGILDKGSPTNFLQQLSQPSLFIQHALLLLTVPVSICLGYLYRRQEVLTKELGRKIIEKTLLLGSYEILFSKLINLVPDPVVIVDREGKILEINEAVETMGFTRECLLGKNFLEIETLPNRSKALAMKNLSMRMLGLSTDPYEIEILGKNGEKKVYEVNASKIEWNGKPANMTVLRDITKRINVEEKLRVISKLTRHDARNKIQDILVNSFLARKEKGTEVLKHLEEIDTVCKHLVKIYDFARDYQELGRVELTYIEVDKAVKEAVSLLQNKRIVTIQNYCHGLKVLADSLLTRIFYNLLDNSLKHGETVTKITVRYIDRGDCLKIIYEDDGRGIPADEKKSIFKEKYEKRSGHGLYLCLKICDTYGWEIREKGEKGKGVRFIITIPNRTNPEGMSTYQLAQEITPTQKALSS